MIAHFGTPFSCQLADKLIKKLINAVKRKSFPLYFGKRFWKNSQTCLPLDALSSEASVFKKIGDIKSR